MVAMPPDEVVKRLGSGLLAFPVTHLDDELAFDEAAYRDNIGWLTAQGCAGMFPAGGTGEFFSLTPNEVERVVRAAVEEAPTGMPVIAPAGHGTASAVDMARSAARAGADGILLLPPYLTEAGQSGLEQHVRAVCRATDLAVIVYNRANAVYTDMTLARLAGDCPTLVGFKDGIGDIEQMARVHARLGDRLLYVGGLPTAEMFAMPYQALGLTTYSSAIYNFLPGFALEFYDAVQRRDADYVHAAMNSFFLPYGDLRSRRPGYAVSIIKAGMRVIGRPAGPVRPPLTDLTRDELEDLAALIEKVSSR
ncbi:5-dehydro-4-deoxyglucarate dehydratase [Micromonospora sp. NPDC048830]|uniref:5-dehydro-4-deoxyglucarate dehydratase n=1 Tax=Micromonospora sp. NPDC048830 TaxID=3364257 RepID=UPI003712559D